MAYLQVKVLTPCQTYYNHNIQCPNCRTENTWRQLDSIQYECTRCRCRMGTGLAYQKITYKEVLDDEND